MFNAATIQEIKKELETRSAKEVVAYCLTLAKYKKDSKEFLSYLLFESADPEIFSAKVKAEVDAQFSLLKAEKNLYFTKKSLRKILRQVTRYSRYASNDALTADWLIYFCTHLNESGIRYHESAVLVNMYNNQLKKINTLINGMHEDLQQDYKSDLQELKRCGPK
ncbi:MAG: hypothetical protein M3Q95_08495 [Bacteroidota bacterium]|nr:hypothetical protein [Bacteroidota bacterium]